MCHFSLQRPYSDSRLRGRPSKLLRRQNAIAFCSTLVAFGECRKHLTGPVTLRSGNKLPFFGKSFPLGPARSQLGLASGHPYVALSAVIAELVARSTTHEACGPFRLTTRNISTIWNPGFIAELPLRRTAPNPGSPS